MQKRLAYCLLAWVMLVAYGGMMVVKDYHALWVHADVHSCCCHHSHRAQDAICVLDGLPLSEHKVHSHASFVEADTDEDDCAICHFTVVKVLEPQFFVCGMAKTLLSILPQVDYLFSLYTFLDHCPGRAPPFFSDLVALNCLNVKLLNC